MIISNLKLDNFMLFNKLDIDWSPNINIISGENNTGKTAILKIIYSILKGYNDIKSGKSDFSKDKFESALVSKLQGVFRPDENAIGRLVSRKQGSNRAEVSISFLKSGSIQLGFGNRQEKHIDIQTDLGVDSLTQPIYIPPKEIISATSNFTSLYDDYHISFEETYYDLARLLDRPLRKGANTNEQNKVIKSFEGIVNGNIIQRDKKFYLKVRGAGEFEMGLVSEGYRKLSTIMYLILSGTLGKNSILLWDEPETNMNPKMIKPITEAMLELAKMGVQIFITTHDYFVQQSFNMVASYPKLNKSKLRINFISLYNENGEIKYENASTLSELSNNSVMEEFDKLYDREQEILQ